MKVAKVNQSKVKHSREHWESTECCGPSGVFSGSNLFQVVNFNEAPFKLQLDAFRWIPVVNKFGM